MWRASVVIGVVVVLTAPIPAADPAAVPKVTAVKLVETYRTNEAFADENYAGKQIEVTGKVARISRSPHYSKAKGTGEGMYLLEFEVEGAGKDAKLQVELLMFFDEKDRAALAKLKPGQTIQVRGECRDSRVRWAASPPDRLTEYSEVHVRKCALVENKTQ
jgi:hypothetical protein